MKRIPQAVGRSEGGGETAAEAAAVERVFVRIEKIGAMGALIGALEQLAGSSALSDDGIFSWRVNRTRFRGIERFPLTYVSRLLEYPRVVVIPQVRLTAAARLLLGRPHSRERAALLLALTGTAAGMQVRQYYGYDGSDNISLITFLVATMAKAFPGDDLAREACIRFIAFQACVAYAAAGAIKLVSPVWRDGSAITGILRTRVYGDKGLYRLLRLHPAVARAVAWGVILGELTFPLVLVAPRPVARGILGAGVFFHLVNGRFMGLNRFLWAFTATYPAIAHVSRSLRP
ncbi:hypothetical protein EH183_41960 [Streptomyces sp. CB01881]|uniref:hypothetical protein n=1 Tax=Streptomyces sp. CB01881 TaxID=2078691 RepID=UPI0011E06689|nr:hypothetical protein [Streptomyces sp. CB01881]TYC66561.1 hypothetical protein EH183_41960 [Streptomyces sp. CB01881]